MKIGILGLGKMGEALVHGIRASAGGKKWKVEATTRSAGTARSGTKKLGIPVHTDNLRLATSCDVLILCVKPHQAESVLAELASVFSTSKKRKLLISVAASITTKQMQEWLSHSCPVIRSMPNTPALIGEGMTVLCGGTDATDAHLRLAEKIFQTVGKTSIVDEKLMDGVTGLSGCGPAYAYLIIEALSEAGVKVGLPRDKATLLAAQTLMGASKMVLELGQHPAALKDEVTTPAGCTIDGLMALEEGKLRVTLIKAVLAATAKSESLRNES